VDLYCVAKDFAGPFATVLAASAALCVTFYFNKRQHELSSAQRDIALDKLKFDAFEKRYEVYSQAKALMYFALQQNDFEAVDHRQLKELRAKIEEARFFFGPSVRAFLSEIDQEVESVIDALAGRFLLETKYDATEWVKVRGQLEKNRRALRNFYDEMPSRFESSLRLSQRINE
jgi:hypothetical protein